MKLVAAALALVLGAGCSSRTDDMRGERMQLLGHLSTRAVVVVVLAAGCLLQAGCASEPRTVSGGTIDSPDRGESATGRRIPERAPGRRGAAAPAERETSDAVSQAVDAALRDLASKLKTQAAAGWPAHVPLTSSAGSPRPLLRIRSIMNMTSRHLDMTELEGRIGVMLVDGGLVALAVSDREREEVMDERAYEDSTGAAAEDGLEDAAGLMLTGELTDDIREVDGERTRTVVLLLTIVDTAKMRALIKARGEATDVDER
jgi:hypothetical protein